MFVASFAHKLKFVSHFHFHQKIQNHLFCLAKITLTWKKGRKKLAYDHNIEMLVCKLRKVSELIFIDETVVVGVCGPEDLATTPRRKEPSGEAHGTTEFGFADSSVSVCVKCRRQPPSKLLHRHHTLSITRHITLNERHSILNLMSTSLSPFKLGLGIYSATHLLSYCVNVHGFCIIYEYIRKIRTVSNILISMPSIKYFFLCLFNYNDVFILSYCNLAFIIQSISTKLSIYVSSRCRGFEIF